MRDEAEFRLGVRHSGVAQRCEEVKMVDVLQSSATSLVLLQTFTNSVEECKNVYVAVTNVL